MEPIFERTFDASELMRVHPLRLMERNKQIVFEVACPTNSPHSGTISFARYRSSVLPQSLPAESDTALEHHEGIFEYEPYVAASGRVDWHLNFANTDLFCAYGKRAFAQDELQVGEHPALGAVREALLASSRNQLFVVEQREPTPITIMGVERRCEINTAPDAAAGQPNGLYGRLFCNASPNVIRSVTRPIQPPTISNILAIEAPSNGKGRYTRAQIEIILQTAYSGFRAAQLESQRRLENNRDAVVIHTGFWGCGVYGNDRVLIALLQILAARLARLDRLVFHTVNETGTTAYKQAQSIINDKLLSAGLIQRLVRVVPKEKELAWVLAQIDQIGFQWGESDGN
ncbi:MAG: hypothetical protein ABSH48_27625 [Verrucomicrobiota bacterium]|jgi:hypothetical protein